MGSASHWFRCIKCARGHGRSLTRNMEAMTRAPCKARRISGLRQGEHFLGHLGLAGVSQ